MSLTTHICCLTTALIGLTNRQDKEQMSICKDMNLCRQINTHVFSVHYVKTTFALLYEGYC